MQGRMGYQRMNISGGVQRKKVEQEFLAIFYKELLKDAFKPPKLNSGENSISFASDMMVEQFAKELAQSSSFSGIDLFPNGYNNSTADIVGVNRVVK
jgi:hypothetical protein